MDITTLKENLLKKNYKVSLFDNKEEAENYLVSSLENQTIGFGGSMTLEEMNLYELLGKKNTVFWHWKTDKMTPDESRKKAMTADIYMTSANAIAETGEIINIDGTGNRVAAMTFGHKKVYIIVGENKIAPTREEALWRARNIASPLNAKRLNRKTPCAVNADKCYDCNSPDRICNIFSEFTNKPNGLDVEVIIIHENLGY